jgi:galactitol-specific phosphotransferase system IIC component
VTGDALHDLDAARRRRIDRVGRFYLLAAALLVPWVVYLAVVLPSRQLSAHYDLAWVGFDAALAVSLLVTGVLVVRHSPSVVLPAAGTAALLVTDAWFDVVTASRSGQREVALVLAVLVEVPLAVLSLAVALRVLRRVTSASTARS